MRRWRPSISSSSESDPIQVCFAECPKCKAPFPFVLQIGAKTVCGKCWKGYAEVTDGED